jgi:hypothetical protein
MLIIVEGMDSTGKTTLINKIRAKFPQFVYTKPVPSKGPEGISGQDMVDGTKALFAKVLAGDDYISDRVNMVSEFIYGPICRGHSRLTLDQLDEILPQFYQIQPIVIYCRPSTEAVIKGLSQGFQMAGVATFAWELLDAYDYFFKRLRKYGVDVYEYDWEADPSAHKVLKYLRRMGVDK